MSDDEILDVTEELEVKYGAPIDIFKKGEITLTRKGGIDTYKLPEDHEELCAVMESDFQNLQVRVLSPVDVVITKLYRLSAQDISDISALVNHFGITREQFDSRLAEYSKINDGYEREVREKYSLLCDVLYDE